MELTYKNIRELTFATTVALVVTAIMLLANAVVLTRIMSNAANVEAGIAVVIGKCTDLAVIASVVLFSIWVYRATANLWVLGAEPIRFTPRGAVWAFFIPYANLVRSYQVMAMIWTESQPPVGMKPRSIGTVTAWYALSVYVPFAVGAFLTLFYSGEGVLVAMAAVSVCYTGSALFCAIIVHKVEAWQRAKAEALEPTLD